MQIQFNTDHNINGDARIATYFTDAIQDTLDHYTDYLTRIEVHLADENGGKEGNNDKRCTLEARVTGKKPIAVTDFADTIEDAITGATDKLRASLDKVVGRMKKH